MDRNSTIMGTEGINYALFKIYIKDNKKYIIYDFEVNKTQ
jgi:hypothetical protein